MFLLLCGLTPAPLLPRAPFTGKERLPCTTNMATPTAETERKVKRQNARVAGKAAWQLEHQTASDTIRTIFKNGSSTFGKGDVESVNACARVLGRGQRWWLVQALDRTARTPDNVHPSPTAGPPPLLPSDVPEAEAHVGEEGGDPVFVQAEPATPDEQQLDQPKELRICVQGKECNHGSMVI